MAYGDDSAGAAEVVCDLVAAGPFRTRPIAAGVGETEKDRTAHLEVCLRLRIALLEGVDRSILGISCDMYRVPARPSNAGWDALQV